MNVNSLGSDLTELICARETKGEEGELCEEKKQMCYSVFLLHHCSTRADLYIITKKEGAGFIRIPCFLPLFLGVHTDRELESSSITSLPFGVFTWLTSLEYLYVTLKWPLDIKEDC